MGVFRSGSQPLAGCSGVVGLQSPATVAATRDRVSARHADALPNCVQSASWSSNLPVPLGLALKEHEDPRAFRHIGTRPPGRWGNARRSTHRPRSQKPVAPASRLVAHVAPSVASGLGLRILAAGPAVHRLYSYRGRLHEPDPNNLLGLVHGRRDQLCAASGRARLPRACRHESLSETHLGCTAHSDSDDRKLRGFHGRRARPVGPEHARSVIRAEVPRPLKYSYGSTSAAAADRPRGRSRFRRT